MRRTAKRFPVRCSKRLPSKIIAREKMSLGGLAELLGFSIDEANAFLKKHRVPLEYDFEDLAEDRKAIVMFP